MDKIEVVEFTDPGCSWAWGTEPKLRLLQWRYGDRLSWRRVLGGLIGDMNNYRPDFDPVRAAAKYIDYWHGAYRYTGMTYPVHLQWMYTSTEPAGKAVKAAEQQSDEAGALVLRRLRESTFVFGLPADNAERILDAVKGVDGLDLERFRADLNAEIVAKEFREDWEETRRPNDYVMTLEGDRPGIGRAKNTEGHWRFVFPTVIFRGPQGEATVPGWCEYEEYVAAMESVAPGSTAQPKKDPTPAEVFATWPTAARKELDVLCGEGAEPPKGITSHQWGDGEFFLTAAEAKARELI
ncbi:MAG: DsbA family protein [Actinomycetota bacterium]